MSLRRWPCTRPGLQHRFAAPQVRPPAARHVFALTISHLSPPSPSPGAAAASSDAATEIAEAPAGKPLREVTKEDYYSVIRDAGSKLVVVDCYTEW